MYLALLRGAISHLWTDQIRIQFFTLWVSSFILFPRSLRLNDHLLKILNNSQSWIELEPMTAWLCFSLPCLWASRRSQWGPINCKRSFYPVRIELRVCYRIYEFLMVTNQPFVSLLFSHGDVTRRVARDEFGLGCCGLKSHSMAPNKPSQRRNQSAALF